jgi:predicted glycosyltransferase
MCCLYHSFPKIVRLTAVVATKMGKREQEDLHLQLDTQAEHRAQLLAETLRAMGVAPNTL